MAETGNKKNKYIMPHTIPHTLKFEFLVKLQYNQDTQESIDEKNNI